ncbi:hypothetical protein AVEN_153581-1 [Araneus ventricosus]|uniref:CCHC-type domain-containing protein n=1 Tax=Araneus ventricosus TaxID=182803 RepID=A0A4Y2BPD5_ARAVE|nr:hypothetical protein AVEN_153581-1 [Araneus ventricosus]
MEDEPDLVSLIRRILQEEVQQMMTRADKPVDSYSQSLDEIVQDEVEKALATVTVKPMESLQRSTDAATTRKSCVPVYCPPTWSRKTDLWRTADKSSVCFHCGCPGRIVHYCRERKAVFDSY